MNGSNIIEKIKYWEEQDRINEALIPRVLEMHEIVKKVSMQNAKMVDDLQKLQLEIKKRKSNKSNHHFDILNIFIISLSISIFVLYIYTIFWQ